MIGYLKYTALAALMSFTALPMAQALSIYSDVSFVYLNKKIVNSYFLTNFGYSAGAGASIGLINLIEVDVNYSLNIFDNSRFRARVAQVVPLDPRGDVIDGDLYGTLEEILARKATVASTEISLVLAPPLLIIKPYAAAGFSYNTLTLTQPGKQLYRETVNAPMLKMGARVNYLFAFIGLEYKSNTARFNVDLNYDGQKTPLLLGGDKITISAGITL